jgi:hypothetical protein
LRRKSKHQEITIINAIKTKSRAMPESTYTHNGKAPAAIRGCPARALPPFLRPFVAEYPQAGQPLAKSFSCPEKPQAGQRTDAKNLPQRGQAGSSRSTSVPQLSQKNRGDFMGSGPEGVGLI